MRAKGWVLAGVLLLAWPGAAAGLSGELSTSFTLGGSLATWNSLELRFSFPGFELQSLTTWQGLNLRTQSFTLSGDFGHWAIQAGVVLEALGKPYLATWATQDFQVAASFVALELRLGSLTLRFALHAGP